jgi:integrase/recombinase XerD
MVAKATKRNITIVAPVERTPLQILVDDYLAHCRARGLSRGTIEQAYSWSLREVFLPWAARNDLHDVDEITQRVLDRFTAELLEHGGTRGALSRHTVHSYIRPVRQLLKWAAKEGEPVTGGLPQLPSLPRRVLDTLSREEVARLEDAATTERDKLIVRLLADTGIRVGELCGLRVGAMTRHERGALIRIHGKGDRERMVPLRPQLARRLERYVRGRPVDAKGDHLFLSLRRAPDGNYQPLTRSGVLQLCRNLADRTGMKKRVHPHLFRHSFATEALRRGMNPVQLANILGHSGLQMIERVYSHLTPSDGYDAIMRILADD